jgi:tape measure domain-containing protein
MHVELNARIANLEKGLSKANQQIAQFASKTDKNLKKVRESSERSSKSILQMRRNLDTAFRGIAGSFVAREMVMFSRSIARAAFDVQMLNQRIKVFTGNTSGFAEAYKQAQALGVSVDKVAMGMGRIVAVGAEMGVTTAEAKRMTATFQQLALLSGSSVKESQAAFIQFTQALSANRLSGEELRSVREQAPLVAQAIAKYMGISVGEIKKVAEEGKITAEVMRGAMAAAAEDAAAKFKMLPVTLERQQAALENSWGRVLAGLDTVTKQSAFWQTFNTGLMGLFDSFAQLTVSPEFLTDDELDKQIDNLTRKIQELQGVTIAATPAIPEMGIPAMPERTADLSEERERRFALIQERQSRGMARALEEEGSAAKAAATDWNALIDALKEYKVESKKIEPGAMASFYDKMNEATRTSLEEAVADYEHFMAQIDELMSAGVINKDTANLRIGEFLDETLEEVKITSEKIYPKAEREKLNEFGVQAARNMQSAFADFLFDPFEDGLKGMLGSFVDTIRRMVAEIASQQILTAMFSGLAGSSNSVLKGIGTFFGGGKATGGPVLSSKAYIVGEKGPELLVGASGRIIPGTDMVGGGGGTVIAPVYNIDARGATQDLAKQLPSILAAHARQTVEMARRAINDDVSRNAFGRA